ncbi:MAG: tRNA (adenine-N1)-methyltransferase [Promethearchaeota archaeon]
MTVQKENENIIQENDLIYLILEDRKRWLVQARAGETFHTHHGFIEFDELINKKPFGSCIFSKPLETQGYKFYVMKPLPSDYILHMKRKTQIIYPKDAGLILLYTGIGPGSIIIEAGCGSGALTCILGNYVRPNGHVYSYDVREKSLNRALKNVKRAGLQEVVTIQEGDILKKDLELRDVDCVVLDMPTPWDAIPKIKKYLRLSGSICCFSPTMEQVKKNTFSLKNNDFIEVITIELLERRLQVKENATRPETRMIGHTGYLTFGRKVEPFKENPYREKKPKKKEIIDMTGMPLRGENNDH